MVLNFEIEEGMLEATVISYPQANNAGRISVQKSGIDMHGHFAACVGGRI